MTKSTDFPKDNNAPSFAEVCVEWAPFAVKKNVTEKEIMATAELLQKEFIGKQDGFLKREMLKGSDNLWGDLIYWANDDAAQKASQNAEKSSSCMTYFQLMDTSDTEKSKVSCFHYKIKARWE